MSESIAIALIGIIPSVLVAIVSIVSNNAIVKVKIEELEKHVNKHNQVIERTYTLERDLATYWSRYDELKERIARLEKKRYDKIDIKSSLFVIKGQLRLGSSQGTESFLMSRKLVK